jgi:hypothetical protein
MNFKERFARSLKIVGIAVIVMFVGFVALGVYLSSNPPKEMRSGTRTSDIPSSQTPRRYPGAEYVTETFVGDGVTRIFKLKTTYTDVEVRIDGRMATMGMWGNCATVDVCHDTKGARLIFQEVPARGRVINFTGTAL